LAFDFRVEYKPGTMNVVVDASSRRDTEAQACAMALLSSSFKLFDDIHVEYDSDAALAAKQSSTTRKSTSGR
jgi:hypothetical protein